MTLGSLLPSAGREEIFGLVIGRIVGPRGVKGELKVALSVPEADWLLAVEQVALGEARVSRAVTRARLFRGHLLLCVDGVVDRNQAEEWRGALVRVRRSTRPLAGEGQYDAEQILGLSVISDVGEALGRVTEVLATGANDVYVVRGDAGDLLLPAISEVIRYIDLDRGVVTVHLLDGLR